MRRIGVVFSLIGAATASFWACGKIANDPAEPEGRSDAATDARRLVDAGAGDGPLFSPGPNGGSDAGFALFPGSWSPIPNIPACDVRLSDDTSAIGPLVWDPCPSGRAGCQVSEVTWPNSGALSVVTLNFPTEQPSRLVNGVPYVLYQRRYTIDDPAKANLAGWIEVLQPISGGNPTAALGWVAGTPRPACTAKLNFGDTGLVVAGLGSSDLPSSESEDLVYASVAPWSAPHTPVGYAARVAGFGLLPYLDVQNVNPGDRRMYVETKSPDTVAMWDLATGATIVPQRNRVAGTPPAIFLEAPWEVPDGALVAAAHDSYFSVDLIRKDGSLLILIAPTSPHLVTYATLDRVTNQLVWVESDAAAGVTSYANSVLWSAPYTADPAMLARKKIALLSDSNGRGGDGMVASAGVALNLVGDTEALVTRLSDGMGWLVKAEPGTGFTQPVWVDDQEVWLATAPRVGADWQSHQANILRIARSTLGSPSVPPGL